MQKGEHPHEQTRPTPTGVSPRSYPAAQGFRRGTSHSRDRSRDRCLRWHPKGLGKPGRDRLRLSFGKRLKEIGIVPSMGRTGTALEDTMPESFVAALKTALLVHRGVLQRTQVTFGFGPPEPCRLRGGYNGRNGCSVDATHPRDRGNSSGDLIDKLLVSRSEIQVATILV